MLRHIPVLANEIYENLPNNWEHWFDWTFWHWGHAEFFLSHEKEKRAIDSIKIIGTDIDLNMIEKAKELTKEYKDNINILHSSYASILQISKDEWLFDYELLDLWVNLEHFKDWSRWFSIKTNAPLDMRFDQTKNDMTAAKWLKTTKTEIIKSALEEYWDFSPKTSEYLTKLICEQRQKSPLEDQLKIFLSDFPTTLKKGWRCFIITYHSVEDRITKNALKELAENWEFKLINKKVIVPHYTEVQKNKAARSAKLRIIEKL